MSTKQLPETFQGAEVMRGLAMSAEDLDKHIERKAKDAFDATREMWLVVEDKALENLDTSTEIRGFTEKQVAIRVARGLANGNVDYRVLRVTDQILIVATDNSL